jgi:hypothetical protein
MNRKSISIVLICVVLSSALGLSGYARFDLDKRHAKLQSEYALLVNEHNLLQSDYQTLNDTHRILAYDYTKVNQTLHSSVNNYTQLNETHRILILEYNELNASYRIFVLNYTELKQDYDELSANYADLSDEYVVLQDQHASLFSDYNALLGAFNEPLSYEETPLTYELEQWLATDETDALQYDEPDFVCGDFAVMLSLHAKLKHWDMGLVGVFGHTESYESFDHAFNAIISDEGLVYVEPQTDEVWWYPDHEEMTEGKWWEFPDFGNIYVGEYVIILWYD